MRASNQMAVVGLKYVLLRYRNKLYFDYNLSSITRTGTWNLRNKKLAIGATLELATVCQDTRMNVPNKNPPILHANTQGNIEESLKQACPEQISFISVKPTTDVTHSAPGPGSNERPSIAAVTASDGVVKSVLPNLWAKALKEYYFIETGFLKPVRKHKATEVEAIKTACHSLDDDYNPTTTFIEVQKRHHTHDNGFNPDMLQTLSYNLCNLYARCKRLVYLLPNEQNFTRAAPFSKTKSEEGTGGAAATFGVVKPELQRVNITN
ncbi:hypothetical protein C1646_758543 [Rhizophagus diaphanus]|nr:hypothetical protein C1646_758543 [Rhizophagus diaphanus] [Rhizophagus sp. MUCL 43196]